jgi:hypothetical protein
MSPERRRRADDAGDPPGGASAGASPSVASCPACGVSTVGLRARLPWSARLDPLARAVAGGGVLRCPACGHRWPADDERSVDPG